MKKQPANSIGLTVLLRELLARPEGMRAKDPALAAYEPAQIEKALYHLRKAGQAFSGTVCHKFVIYHADKARAEALAERERSVRKTGTLFTIVRQPPPAIDRKAWDAAEPVITSATKITRGPNFAPRFQVFDPPVPVYGQHGRLGR